MKRVTPPSAQRRLDVLTGDKLDRRLPCTQEGRREHAAFEYVSAWFSAATRYEIDPTLPLVTGPQFAPVASNLSTPPASRSGQRREWRSAPTTGLTRSVANEPHPSRESV